MKSSLSVSARAAALGALTGSRTFSVLALLANALKDHQPRPTNTPGRWLARPPVATALLLAAAGELVGDKLPGVPNRTDPPSLVGRAVAGALAGATVAQLDGRKRLAAAALGAGAAVAGAFVGFYARRWVVARTHWPDAVVALFEDALVVGVGRQLTHL